MIDELNRKEERCEPCPSSCTDSRFDILARIGLLSLINITFSRNGKIPEERTVDRPLQKKEERKGHARAQRQELKEKRLIQPSSKREMQEINSRWQNSGTGKERVQFIFKDWLSYPLQELRPGRTDLLKRVMFAYRKPSHSWTHSLRNWQR